jgi:hypothetical protein
MGTCTFCQDDTPLTREHVWPQWLGEVLLDQSPQRFLRTSGGSVERTWNQPMFKQTVRAVCARCNSEWMSRLEGRARTILSPMVRGVAVQLAPEEQKLIATWALKTAIMAQCAAGERLTPIQDALWLYHEQAPPDTNVIVILAHYRGHRHPLYLAHKPMWFNGPWTRRASPEAYMTTVGVGELVCQVLGTRVYLGDSFRRRGWRGAVSQQIWPAPRLQTWPPTHSLTDDQLLQFAESVA